MTSTPTPQLDPKNMLGSIDMLAEQVRHAWENTKSLSLPNEYSHPSSVVLFGMGGSALGMDIARSLFADAATVPLLIVNDYAIPAYVNSTTFALLSSYSGTTEETLAAAKDISTITKRVAVITTGGELQRRMKENGWPGYLIDPKYNPCGQPRIAVGYAVVGLLRLLSLAKVITVHDDDIDTIIHYLDGNRELLRDAAFECAEKLKGALPVFVGSEFLTGNLHTLANQTNENGKNFACFFTLPEMNHHLMEGLGHPDAVRMLHVVFLESNLYHPRTRKRYDITRRVLDKQQITHSTFIPTAATKHEQAFEVLQWGSYVSFVLAMQNGIDPAPIPWVDFFKHELQRVR